MNATETARPAFDIRPASEHDLLDVAEIEQECELSPWGWDGYYQELTQQPTAFMLVARLPAQDKIVGFIASRFVADEVHVHNFGVRPALRRRGLGRALLRAALNYGRERGATRSFLEVRAGNETAQIVYQSEGFAVIGRRKNYYDQPTEDAVIMSAHLSPPLASEKSLQPTA